jgi:hypothetical protein
MGSRIQALGATNVVEPELRCRVPAGLPPRDAARVAPAANLSGMGLEQGGPCQFTEAR